MDGIHDLGGREGFGRIETDEPEEPFHSAWEARVRGLVNSMTPAPDWNLDWFRHCRELIEPLDYLSRPYFDQWLQTYCAMLVNSGYASVEELATGRSSASVEGLGPPMPPAAVQGARRGTKRYDRQVLEAPAHATGDRVRARSHGASGHTRLPAYVRGRAGRITNHHGAHVLPDANVHGEKRYEHLYTVAFDADELWAEARGRRETVYLNLWESYLDPA